MEDIVLFTWITDSERVESVKEIPVRADEEDRVGADPEKSSQTIAI